MTQWIDDEDQDDTISSEPNPWHGVKDKIENLASQRQQMPDAGEEAVLDKVIDDLRARDKVGTEKYGTTLMTHNGRDSLLDAYQEALDMVMYLKQKLMEDNMVKSISYWQKEIHALAIEKGWYDQKRELPELLMLCVSELSEALEEYRTGYGPNFTYEDDGKPEGVPIELADCVIRILDLCGYLGINLERAITTKHEYNKSREYRHGGKVC